jgi:hypothetical protein
MIGLPTSQRNRLIHLTDIERDAVDIASPQNVILEFLFNCLSDGRSQR